MVLLALCFTHPYTPLRILFTDYEGIYRMFSLSQPASMKMSQNVRKEFNSHRIFWNTYMAAVSLFETPMCNMMSCENTLQFKYLTSYTIKGVGLSIPSLPPPPQPPIEACFETEKIQIIVFSLKGFYIASHRSTRARYHPAKPEVLNHYLYFFFLQDGKLVEEFFGLDCLHFSAQGHAAAALALWRNMVWYYLKTTPMLFSVYAFFVFFFLLYLSLGCCSKKGVGGGGGETYAGLSPIPLSFPFPPPSVSTSAMQASLKSCCHS